ncbi:MAG: hypothetical protein A2273_03640 [Candidatus Edwardsbacteria bacterium RifOxyA12_full_54_48]|uniref:Tyrosine kinase G-rich domain-containing protein n=1 Tax=Candidatus Edwardsbacteria bacterium GWF2_54_11 TaxID=1817851 RepID=A0A1F5RCE2_9BACT|nr:MAG: hypothetical protein A2502_07420 [Candidatus Edwardsbacteria bacterium RifOxyC12_full_54_24]OGF07572.1 MAG: hypothetical protein A2273_03640 [Candidatus Edwardsbacteria bacterium RifOxyA12_full_54_48]OGF12084.1 MAG: hypothetical protein A2024_03605 [Candidatus Edwardsbacteria bacterium GWF2_54_11]OGJ19490.1 MAG: hypothetical protein A2349_09755 [Candidatus Edwardsbacteria bacterium RifOxyB12_full_52_30]
MCWFALLMWGMAGAESVAARIGSAGGAGNGNLVIEVGSMKGVTQKIDRINAEFNPMVKNFNEYTNNQTKKRSININLQVAKEKALALMGSFAELGDVQSKSYSEYQNYYDSESLRQKLGIFKKYLERAISSEKPEPEIVKLLTQQIESLESQLRSSAQLDSTQALIYVTVKERGYDNNPGQTSPRDKYLLGLLSAVLALLLFFLGLLAGWIRCRKKIIADPNV